MELNERKSKIVRGVLNVIMEKFRTSFSLWLFQTLAVILTIFMKASEGSSQSLQYVTGVAIETSYTTPLPYQVKAIYGDFVNTNQFWAQLWKSTGEPYEYELVWQVKITPQTGNGIGEWIILPENERIWMREEYKLGLKNDVIPGPLLQFQDLNSNIIITKENVVLKDVQIGQSVEFEDLDFPYYMPLYLCNRTECQDVRIMLGRLTQPVTFSEQVTEVLSQEPTSNNKALTMTLSPDTNATGEPPIGPREDDDLFNRTTIIGILIGLGILALLLLIAIAVLVGVCFVLEKRKQKEERYRTNILTSSITRGQSNEGFESLASERSDTSSKRLVTSQLPEQSIMVY